MSTTGSSLPVASERAREGHKQSEPRP